MNIKLFEKMISVIIPTYNRADILKICLQKLLAQKGIDFEIIVVDDGSSDNTEEIVRELTAQPTPSLPKGSPLTAIKYFKQKNAGQGPARNHGVRQAKGKLILFLGDDIWVEPDFLFHHLAVHQINPEENTVVLGYSTWDPPSTWEAFKGARVDVNAYMSFLESSGWQFGYGFLKPGFIHNEPYKFFYTSNISMKKRFFEKEHFDEAFKAYGWEDIELGYRLWKHHDMTLFYEPEAKAYHHHFIPETNLAKKIQAVGKSGKSFQTLHPEVDIAPQGFKKLLIKMASNPLTLPLIKLLNKNLYFKCVSWRAFWKGWET